MRPLSTEFCLNSGMILLRRCLQDECFEYTLDGIARKIHCPNVIPRKGPRPLQTADTPHDRTSEELVVLVYSSHAFVSSTIQRPRPYDLHCAQIRKQ